MQELFSNNVITQLLAGITSTQTTLTVSSGQLPANFIGMTTGAQYFRMSLTDAATKTAHEIVFVTAISITGGVATLTVQRNAEQVPNISTFPGSTGITWLTGDYISNEITAGMMVNIYSPSADQANAVRSATDTGTANTYKIALNPSLPTSALYVRVIFKAINANTGASTLQINGGTIYALIDESGAALAGGEIQNNSIVEAIYNGTGYTLLSSTGRQHTNFAGITVPTRQTGDITNNAASTAYVNAMIGNFGGIVSYSAAPTGGQQPVSDFGKLVIIVPTTSAPFSLIMPPVTGLSGGFALHYFNSSSSIITLIAPTGGIYYPSSDGLTIISATEILLRPGMDIDIAWDGINFDVFSVLGGGNAAANGWSINQDGTIDQWGTVSALYSNVTYGEKETASTYVSFPIPFPNQCFEVIVSPQDNPTSAGEYANWATLSASGFYIIIGAINAGTTTTGTASWRARGK